MNDKLETVEKALVRDGVIPKGGFPETPGALSPSFLGQVAACDPRLANAIIRPDLLGWGEPSCGWGWEIVNINGEFTSGAANTQIPFQALQGIVEVDLWIRKVTYTVRRPNAFANNIFKAQSDYYNRLNPNIDFTMVVKSYCRYVISPDPTPLENIEQVFECVCPVGFVLGCSTQISGNFTNLRAFSDGTNNTPDEIPTNVVITLHGVRLPTRYDQCSVSEAAVRMQKMGLLTEGYYGPDKQYSEE